MTPAAATIQYWRENPVAFVYDNFKVEPDAWQKEVLEAFADPNKPRISMQACAGPGQVRGGGVGEGLHPWGIPAGVD